MSRSEFSTSVPSSDSDASSPTGALLPATTPRMGTMVSRGYASRPHTPKYFPPHKYVSVGTVHVYIGSTQMKQIPMVARVSIIDYHGRTLLDTFIHPTHHVEDYRSPETNLQPRDLFGAPSFQEVQHRVAALIQNKIIVGHSLWVFLSIMGLSHPAIDTRDLALFLPLRRKIKSGKVVELQDLIHFYMGRKIGAGYEDSLENTRACMDLFRSCEDLFESLVSSGLWPSDLPPASFSRYFS